MSNTAILSEISPNASLQQECMTSNGVPYTCQNMSSFFPHLASVQLVCCDNGCCEVNKSEIHDWYLHQLHQQQHVLIICSVIGATLIVAITILLFVRDWWNLRVSKERNQAASCHREPVFVDTEPFAPLPSSSTTTVPNANSVVHADCGATPDLVANDRNNASTNINYTKDTKKSKTPSAHTQQT